MQRLSLMKSILSTFFRLLPLFVCASAFAQTTVPSGGGDIGAQINAAEATLPANGGEILVKTQANGQCYSYSVPILITKSIIIQGQGPSTCLSFAGSGVAVTFAGNGTSFAPSGSYVDGFGLRDLTLLGSGTSDGQTGLLVGGASNTVGFYGTGLTISNFGLGLQFGRGAWNFKMEHSIFGLNAQSVHWASSLQFGGENMEFDSVTFVGATFANSVEFDDDITTQFSNLNNLTFVSCNFDSAQLVINNGAGATRLYSPHFENAGVGSGTEPFVRISAYTAASDVVMDGPDFYNDQNNPYPPSFIEIDGGPTVTITQMRSVNLDGTANVPTNLLVNGSANVTLLGDAPLRAAQTQYVIASGSPHMWVMGGQDATNNITSQAPMLYSQDYGPNSQSPVVQIGGSTYDPTVGFNLWSGSANNYYSLQLRESGPNELDFCSSGAAPIGSANYICNAGVVNGVFTNTVPDGTPPISVVSHTPPTNLNAWPATFAASGAQIPNPHITTGKIILPANGQATVPFAQNAQFSQTPTCSLAYQTSAPLVYPQALSANPYPYQIVVFGQPYIGVYFICIGN
jgi:hypothetical protein